MDLAYILGGTNPHLASVVIGETVNQGVPLLGALDGESGAQQCSTTAAADALGVSLEDVTYVTAQQSDGSDAERTAKVIINPDAVFKAKMSGGATADTLMVVGTADTANSAGVLISADEDYSSPSMDNGAIWGLSGANKGRVRKIDELSVADASVLVPFEDIAVGDTFLTFPAFPLASLPNNLQLTSDLKQINAQIAHGTGAEFILVAADFEGRGDSFAYVMFNDHLLSHALAGN